MRCGNSTTFQGFAVPHGDKKPRQDVQFPYLHLLLISNKQKGLFVKGTKGYF
jgi:hypothetical protein